MAFTSLLNPEKSVEQKQIKKKGKPSLRGCDHCPRNEVQGIVKIKGTVEGKRIFIWAQSPGPTENERKKELLGRAGKWWWNELAKVGIERDDCDIQNVVRCFPADWSKIERRFIMRDPSKEEIHCCSIYNDQALVKSKAQVHLVLGRVAAQVLFGKKAKNQQRVFWSDKFRGKVFLLDHPSYFIRGTATEEKLFQFRNTLKQVKENLSYPPGRYGFLETQDYKGITTIEGAEREEKIIIKAARKGRRVIFDLEWGTLGGQVIPLCAGFSYKMGRARTLLLEHLRGTPDRGPKTRKGIRQVVKRILENPNIRFSMHHGSSDVPAAKELLGAKISRKSYDFDSNYSEYMAYPGRHSYKLSEVAEVRFPEFAGHKNIVADYSVPDGMTYEEAAKKGKLNLAMVPWKEMVLYNCADCDLEKRIEVSTKDKVKMPLLHAYMDAQFTLERMEKNGPLFDYKQEKKLEKIYPVRRKRLANKLRLMARDPEFNPGSPAQVADVLYDLLKAPIYDKYGNEDPDGKRTTAKGTLEILSGHDTGYGQFAKLVDEYRAVAKIESTYLESFKRSADMNNGRLKTIFWLTGTRTGRMSSGGGKDKSKDNPLVNLQNIHGDPNLQNMLVSDLNWEDVYRAWKNPDKKKDWWEDFLDYHVFLAFDHKQLEVRQLAQETGDPVYIAIFNDPTKDIHSEVGHAMTRWSVEKIQTDKQTRKLVKNFHFGVIYGCLDESMVNYLKAKGVTTTLAKVKKFTAGYFNRFKKVKPFIERKRREVEHTGGVTNILGFRVPIDPENSVGGFWKNQAINFPIQGGAHQLMVIAMAILSRKPKTYKKIKTPQMEIHDSLAFRVKLRDLFQLMGLGQHLLEKDTLKTVKKEWGLDWKVPLVAEANAGFRFGGLVEIKKGQTIEMFLNNWCQKNRELTIKLQKELKAVAA